ncbi:MAG: tetratricopeptide repeat protein [Acidobacteriota bacterium]
MREPPLAFAQRFDDAIASYERAARSEPHRHRAELGKADALLALERAAEALALFEQASERAPHDLDALEGRALALRQLGRDAEAEALRNQIAAAADRRSELRVPPAHRGTSR